MKKIALSIAALALFINASNAQDKAFKKGDVTVDFGIGIAVYGTRINQEYNQQVWNGTSIVTERVKKDTADAAASSIYPLIVEYGVSNWFGIGVRGAFSNYFESAEKSNNYIKPTVRGMDADLVANFHLIKSKHFDMPINIVFGYSHFKYLSNDSLSAKAIDNGLNYGIQLVPRIYFGQHIGMFFNIGYMGYTYPSLLFSNYKDSNTNNDNDQDMKFKLKGNGFNIGLGLIAKF
jgi:hypothetical protein